MSYRNIGAEEFDSLLKIDGYVLIDVRPESEQVEGVIEGFITLNFFDPNFPTALESLDKSKNYLVHCRSGNRSGKACEMMESMGFTGELYNLDGGIRAWNEYKGL